MTFGAFMAVHRSPYGRLVGFLFQSRILKRQIGEHLGATINQITNKSLNSFLVPLPRDEAEQSAIATALSDVDALLAAQDALIAKKRAIKQGAMQELLTGKRRLPGFSGGWDVKRLGSVLRFQVGFPFSSLHFNGVGNGIRLVKNRDLKADDQLVYYNGAYELGFVVKSGDVLIGMDGDFLPCMWAGGEALLNQRIGRIVPSKNLDLTYACYRLVEPLKEIEAITSSTTVKHLSHGDVEGIEMPLPDIDEQIAIADVLREMTDEIAAIEAQRAKTAKLKQGMLQELLTGRIRLI
jgi:type I restriction enzyme S subunit